MLKARVSITLYERSPEMGRIAIYTRVSSEKQAAEDRYSLTVQKERCEAYSYRKGIE